MYRNESSFSKAFITTAKKYFSLVQRVETGSTGVGVPDIYAVGNCGEQWFELKNAPEQSITQKVFTVDWRRGQQNWARIYKNACNKHVVTVMACSDGFVFIDMLFVFKNNKVNEYEYHVTKNLDRMLSLWQ